MQTATLLRFSWNGRDPIANIGRRTAHRVARENQSASRARPCWACLSLFRSEIHALLDSCVVLNNVHNKTLCNVVDVLTESVCFHFNLQRIPRGLELVHKQWVGMQKVNARHNGARRLDYCLSASESRLVSWSFPSNTSTVTSVLELHLQCKRHWRTVRRKQNRQGLICDIRFRFV